MLLRVERGGVTGRTDSDTVRMFFPQIPTCLPAIKEIAKVLIGHGTRVRAGLPLGVDLLVTASAACGVGIPMRSRIYPRVFLVVSRRQGNQPDLVGPAAESLIVVAVFSNDE